MTQQVVEQLPLQKPSAAGGFWLRLGLLILSAGLLTLAFAPAQQFYVAWLGLVPWLWAIRSTRSALRAGLWGWFGFSVTLFCNLSYLFEVRPLSAPALAIYLAVPMGIGAALIRAAGLLELPMRITPARLFIRAAVIGAVFVATEWVRGNVAGAHWLYVSHTQLRFRSLCQIADVTGSYGVTFCVVLVNALGAMTFIHLRAHRQTVIKTWSLALGFLLAANLYGFYRLRQQTFAPGPTVVCIQPNDREIGLVNTDRERRIVSNLMAATFDALRDRPADLVLWPESSVPPLNDQALTLLSRFPNGVFYAQVRRGLHAFAHSQEMSLLTGGRYADGHFSPDGKFNFDEIRNSAYYFSRTSDQISRYDKIVLMPFGEVVPMRGIPFIHRLLLHLTPNRESYFTSTDPEQRITLFELAARDGQTCHFVSPICWEDLDGLFIRKMVRDETKPSGKRADFLAILSNEAWFDFGEPIQHLQAEAFRCIENRVPALRSVNGGISAAIDSCGRVTQAIPINTSGSIRATLKLDSRATFYTRWGDAFAGACGLATIAVLGAAIRQRAGRARNG